MGTVFSRIIAGELPGTFVWRDDRCVAFLSINPMAPGHTLVVPIEEVDHWVDADAELVAHLFEVTRVIGLAQRQAFRCARVGVIVAGYEVPHTHVHVIPTSSMDQFDFATAARSVEAADLDAAAAAMRAELRAMGRTEVAGDIAVAEAVAAGPAAEPGAEVVVRGTVTYRQRMALTPDAVVTVEVRDVSVADATSQVVVDQVIHPEHQVPIPFSIAVPGDRLDPDASYSVGARITIGGRLAFISDTHHPVSTDAPTDVEIVVVPAAGAD